MQTKTPTHRRNRGSVHLFHLKIEFHHYHQFKSCQGLEPGDKMKLPLALHFTLYFENTKIKRDIPWTGTEMRNIKTTIESFVQIDHLSMFPINMAVETISSM